MPTMMPSSAPPRPSAIEVGFMKPTPGVAEVGESGEHGRAPAQGRRTRNELLEHPVMTTPEPRPTAGARRRVAPASRRSLRRAPLRRLQQHDRGRDVERRRRARTAGRGRAARPCRRGSAPTTSASRRIDSPLDREPRPADEARAAAASCAAPSRPPSRIITMPSSPGSSPGTVYGLMSCASSRSMRERADSTAMPNTIQPARRAGRSRPAPALRRRGGRRRVAFGRRRHRCACRRRRSGLRDADRVGRDLGLAAVEEQPGVGLDGREHRLLRRLAGRRREQRAAARWRTS